MPQQSVLHEAGKRLKEEGKSWWDYPDWRSLSQDDRDWLVAGWNSYPNPEVLHAHQRETLKELYRLEREIAEELYEAGLIPMAPPTIQGGSQMKRQDETERYLQYLRERIAAETDPGKRELLKTQLSDFEKYLEAPMAERGYGEPKSEGERKREHLRRYGTEELPPRGTGLKTHSSPEAHVRSSSTEEHSSEESQAPDILLHCIPHAYGSPGIVWDRERAMRSECTCYEYKGKHYCFVKGIVGMLSQPQVKEFCGISSPVIIPEAKIPPGLKKRLETFRAAVDICKKELEGVTDGLKRLEVWLTCMGREARARGTEL